VHNLVCAFQAMSRMILGRRTRISAFSFAIRAGYPVNRYHKKEHSRGGPLADVLTDLSQEFCPRSVPSCSWGEDIPVLAKTCASMKLVNPFRMPIDLCKVFQSVFALKQQPGLSAAIKMLGLEFDGFPHGALSDARNAARVHASILRWTRQETDRTDDRVVEQKEVVPLSPFAQKLAESFK
jgi:inhibitor of KinA sporulation pathway (predicted exonuclease)